MYVWRHERYQVTSVSPGWGDFDPSSRIEGFMRQQPDGPSMSKATKIVVGTLGVSALLAVVLILALALG